MKQSINRYQDVFELANNAKTALIELYNESGHFSDNDRMLKGGLMADAVGLTSIMLVDIAFSGFDDGNVIKETDSESISSIINDLLPQLYEKISKNGYTAEPIISRQKTKNIFNKEKGMGSTDTITWMLSLCSIARYADRKGLIDLRDECSDIIAEITAETLLLLCRSQLSDGTWGFMTNEKDAAIRAKRSLYFSYIVSQSFADFFDYIRGDIDNPNENYQETYQDYYDKDFVAKLDQKLVKELGKGVIDAVYEARQKLQDWIITFCLPVLPKLSSCMELKASGNDTHNERQTLGIWASSGNAKGGLNYFNLYYTNYILDMIITSEVDNRFRDLKLEDYIDEAYSPAPSEEIKDTIQYRILQSYRTNPSISDSDKEYFLGLYTKGSVMEYRREKQHISSFLEDYHQQAIHNSRAMYMASSHSNVFWDQSELKIEWEHDSPIIDAETNSISGITDPAFVPMALRTNASFCFYKADSGDFFVDNLFDYIRSDVFSVQSLEDSDEDDYEFCVQGLWDTLKFNLFVTERSIEAIVDYFDYLNKLFPRQEEVAQLSADAPLSRDSEADAAPKASSKTSGRSDLDYAIEKKIKDFLLSDEGKKVIKGSLPAAHSNAAQMISPESFAALLKDRITQGDSLKCSAENYAMVLTAEERKGKDSVTHPFIELFNHIKSYSLIDRVFSVVKRKKDESESEYQERVYKIYERLSTDIDDLYVTLISGIESSNYKSSDLKKWWQKFKTDNSSDY